jgi:hypothetical protein
MRIRMRCAHCGAKQRRKDSGMKYRVIWHHPNNDGHLGRIDDLVGAIAPVEQLMAEIERCVPLCRSCHTKEHRRMALHDGTSWWLEPEYTGVGRGAAR